MSVYFLLPFSCLFPLPSPCALWERLLCARSEKAPRAIRSSSRSHKSLQDRANNKLLCSQGPKPCNIQSSALHKKTRSSRYCQPQALMMLFSQVICKDQVSLQNGSKLLVEQHKPSCSRSRKALSCTLIQDYAWLPAMLLYGSG